MLGGPLKLSKLYETITPSRGGGGDRNCCNPEEKKDNDANCNTEIIATIVRGIDDNELNTRYQKAHIWKLSEVMATRELKSAVGPTMAFGLEDLHPLQTPHNDDLVIQLKIATTMEGKTPHRRDVSTKQDRKEGGHNSNSSTFGLGKRARKALPGTHLQSGAHTPRPRLPKVNHSNRQRSQSSDK
ncbi:hypothetical protein Cgig2_009952 [Carnegiea gigantea]|uniref:Uncharacterized protein n=1 Tax=Carnegiea gigantea TaxID=171969 RepID=A0A9Q1JJT6_9CARY|nr:hypothetical protein Cgig2_009952 [Carnegiea gigantea]